MLNTLNTDVSPRHQDNSYRYALNATLELKEGNMPNLSTEEGNVICGILGAKILGHTHTNINTFVLFLDNNKIVEYNPVTCSIRTIIDNPNLKFTTHIQAIFKMLNSCDRYIYFAEKGNRFRYINIDKTYTDVNELNYSPELEIPIIELDNISSNGSLSVGTYVVAIRYLDKNLTPTNFLSLSNTINISDYPNFDTKTTKSFAVNITKDNKFPNYQLAIIEYTTGNQSVSAVRLLPINTSTYTGTNYETNILLNEVVTDYKILREVFTLTKTLGRLFVANIENEDFDYYKIASYLGNNSIPIRWVSKKVIKSQNLLYKSFRRNEVYAFGLKGIFKEGDSTPVFHIPARQKNTIDVQIGNSQSGTGVHARLKVTNAWDTELVDSNIPNCTSFSCKELELNEFNKSKVLSNNFIVEFNVNIKFGFTTKVSVSYDGTTKSFSTSASNFNNSISFPKKSTKDYTIEYLITDNTCSYYYVTNTQGYSKEVKHILSAQFNGIKKQERYKVYNTAIINQSKYKDYHQHGEFSYYENCTKYPAIECNSLKLFPLGNIRHFKFPDATLCPINDDTHVYPLGIEYDLNAIKLFIKQNLPELYNKVQKWVLVVADKESTVLDSGIVQPVNKHDKKNLTKLKDFFYKNLDYPDAFTINYPIITPTNVSISNESRLLKQEGLLSKHIFSFYSPKTLFEDTLEEGFINVHRGFGPKDVESQSQGDVKTPKNSYLGSVNIVDTYCVTDLTKNNSFPPPDYSRVIQESKLISPVKHIQDSDAGEYKGINHDLAIGLTHKQFIYSNNTAVISLAENINELNTINNKLEPVYYYASINSNKEVYSNILNLNYNYYGDSNFIGDTYITRFDFTLKSAGFAFANTLFKILGFLNLNTEIADWLGAIESSPFFYQKNLVQSYIESEYNTQLRFKGEKEYEDFYRSQTPISFLDKDSVKYNDKLYEYYPDYNKLSKDFNQWSNNKIYQSFNGECSQCNFERNRIYYSEASFQESKIDNWRLIKVNNYQDLQDAEQIYKLFIDKEELYASTEKHLWMIPTRQAQLTADVSNITIGLQELFSIPAKRVSSVDYIYGGSKYPSSFLSTEFGTFYISDNKLLHLSDGLKEVNTGMRNFLKENLRSFEQRQLEELEIDYHNPFTYQITYDPRHTRIIITKRDNIFKKYSANTKFINGNWYYNNKILSKNLVEFFEDKSFVLSYSLLTNTFVSFHSYLNDYMFNDHESFYSLKNKSIYKHDQLNYLNFYDLNQPFIIDLVLNPKDYKTKTWDYVYIYKQGINTFNNYVAYNDEQSTGLTKISKFKDLFSKFNLKEIDRRENLQLERDRTNKPFFSEQWEDILFQYPIDKVPINKSTKQNLDLPRLRHTYLQLRLYYLNTTKLSLDLVNTVTANSIR